MRARNNPTSADNQQERPKEFLYGYVVGLVDGEGTFHVAIQARPDLPLGVSVIPEFHICQDKKSKAVLALAAKVFGCGYIKPNHRRSKDSTYVYVVRSRTDLLEKIIPFFERFQLRTEKRKDFLLFAEVIRLMSRREHLSKDGLKEIVEIAYSMNNGGARRSRKKDDILTSLESSETIRRSRPGGGKI